MCLPPELEQKELYNGSISLFNLKNISNINEKTTVTIISTTSTIKILETVYKVEYEKINKTIDITKLQSIKLQNLKPKKCNNAGCSDGYFKCKADALDILNINHTYSFNERMSTGVLDFLYPKEYTDECVPVRYDNFTEYIQMHKVNWYIDVDNENITLHKWSQPNKTVTLNRSQYYQQQNEEWIILRKV